jgi:signal transduction histidine kinase
LNLQQRGQVEFERDLPIQAQTLAAGLGRDQLRSPQLVSLQRSLTSQRRGGELAGRVIVVNAAGRLVADSAGTENVGERYATPQRPELGIALRSSRPNTEIRYSTTLGEAMMVAAAPILDPAIGGVAVAGAVRITHSLADVQANVRRDTFGLLAIGAAGLIAGLVLAFAVANSLSRPLTRLAASARRLGEGDLDARSEASGGGAETEELARSFDEMADRLERTLRAQREFVANASHQLRTPLTGMKLRIESALTATSDDAARADLAAADGEVDRLASIVDRLLAISRRIESGAVPRTDVGSAIASALERWRARAEAAGSALDATQDGGVAAVDPGDVDQILDNLIENAIAYAPGPIVVRSTRRDDGISVAVEDRGPGIPEDERAHVVERFARGRQASASGSGLGLAIVRELIERWTGSMSIDDSREGGVRVEVRLPAVAESQPQREHTRSGGRRPQ